MGEQRRIVKKESTKSPLKQTNTTPRSTKHIPKEKLIASPTQFRKEKKVFQQKERDSVSFDQPSSLSPSHEKGLPRESLLKDIHVINEEQALSPVRLGEEKPPRIREDKKTGEEKRPTEDKQYLRSSGNVGRKDKKAKEKESDELIVIPICEEISHSRSNTPERKSYYKSRSHTPNNKNHKDPETPPNSTHKDVT